MWKNWFAKSRFQSGFWKRREKWSATIRSIGVLYYIPTDQAKAVEWNDGFVAAMREVEGKYRVRWFNGVEGWPSKRELAPFDLLMVKSNWDWIVDRHFRKKYHGLSCRKALVISGVASPPRYSEMLKYDLLFYETDWYAPQIAEHPCIQRAFGINTEIMRPGQREKKWDVLSIGALVPSKRYEKLAHLPGRKLVIGEIRPSSRPIVDALEKAGVELKDWVAPEQLREYILASRKVYIPAAVNGGGERAFWEARACGVPVETEPDNSKLRELLTGPVGSHLDYARELLAGINNLKGGGEVLD